MRTLTLTLTLSLSLTLTTHQDEDEGGDVGHEDHGGRDVLSTVEPRGEAHLVRGGGGVRVRVHGMVHRVVHREACEPEGKSG